MNTDITLKQPENADPEMVKARMERMKGLYIFGSNHCPTHKTSLILVVPDPAQVEAECVLEAIEDFKGVIMKQLVERGLLVAVPVAVGIPGFRRTKDPKTPEQM